MQIFLPLLLNKPGAIPEAMAQHLFVEMIMLRSAYVVDLWNHPGIGRSVTGMVTQYNNAVALSRRCPQNYGHLFQRETPNITAVPEG